jgi:hypothetical protein
MVIKGMADVKSRLCLKTKVLPYVFCKLKQTKIKGRAENQ